MPQFECEKSSYTKPRLFQVGITLSKNEVGFEVGIKPGNAREVVAIHRNAWVPYESSRGQKEKIDLDLADRLNSIEEYSVCRTARRISPDHRSVC